MPTEERVIKSSTFQKQRIVIDLMHSFNNDGRFLVGISKRSPGLKDTYILIYAKTFISKGQALETFYEMEDFVMKVFDINGNSKGH